MFRYNILIIILYKWKILWDAMAKKENNPFIWIAVAFAFGVCCWLANELWGMFHG